MTDLTVNRLNQLTGLGEKGRKGEIQLITNFVDLTATISNKREKGTIGSITNRRRLTALAALETYSY